MPRLLVLSFASLNEPHRAPYDRLARDRGWEVHVVAPSAIRLDGGRTKEADAPRPDARYVLHTVPLALGRQARFTWFLGLASLAARVRPDVVFAEYDPGSVALLQAALVAPRSRRYAFSVENIDRRRFREALRAARSLDPKSFMRDLVVGALGAVGEIATTGIACISEDGRSIFEGRSQKPVHVVPLGTDTELFRPSDATALRAELGLEEAFVFGYFGRLVPEKGVHLLIEALAALPPRFKLLLDMFKNFEPGSYAATLLARADALGVADRIVTIDVPHARVPEYMRASDVVVLPSLTTPRWKEQFGRVLPEAMACGVPVIGSRSGNIPHMIEDAGLLIPEGDVPALVGALQRLESDGELRRDLAGRGRARVQELFSVEAQVRSLERLFAEPA